ncbi:hypothetical protein [Gracilimonas sediminicola]|uniref:Uncharacterized protein n=1 Tax=Gracilimonas sediminicola TaxID=2952158 RepID=A0A9X2L0E0_9BACT|nr:hypothetical protein [Gracilimonas sediminicola]MCP9290041.1 hypothetical protein [Gracilimonas sediminicola]
MKNPQTITEAIPSAVKAVFDSMGSSNEFGIPSEIDTQKLAEYVCEQEVMQEALTKQVKAELEERRVFLEELSKMYFDEKKHYEDEIAEHEYSKAGVLG